MRIHCLQHVNFEDEANVSDWASRHGHPLTRTRLYAGEALPQLDTLDWLVLLGGPMNVYEHDAYPWLGAEKEFLARAIEGGKTVLGICLGAQLAADVLGGRVTANGHKEIGWFPVSLTDSGARSPLLEGFPRTFPAMHWHGDTFAIPPGAQRLAESEACPNQGFCYDGRVIGMQFHLDYSAESIEKMLHHCADEMVDCPYIQSASIIRGSYDQIEQTSTLLDRLLDNLAARGG